MPSLNEWSKDVHQLARDKGWYDNDDGNRNIPEMLALIHSEISEALEEYRTGDPMNEILYETKPLGPNKPIGFGIEIADAVIRIMDLCEYVGIDLEETVRIKHEFNKSRRHRHGGKIA